MPSEKRARQRAAREAKLAEQAKVQRRSRLLRNGVIVAIVAAAVIGLVYLTTKGGSKKTTTTTTSSTASTTTTTGPHSAAQAAANQAAVSAGCPASTSARVNTLKYASAPPISISAAKTYTATVKTDAGTFVITLDAKQAPQTVNNFVFLAQKGYYHCVTFHRVIPQFVDQTGDPTGTGQGGPGYTIPDENPPKAANPANQYPVGSVAMANTGAAHSGGSQWFVVAGAQGTALPNRYALFGQVTSGLSVIQQINADGNTQGGGVPPLVIHRILTVTITST